MLPVFSDDGEFSGRMAEAWISADRIDSGGIFVYTKRKKRIENLFCDRAHNDDASAFRLCAERLQLCVEPVVLHDLDAGCLHRGRLSQRHVQNGKTGKTDLCGGHRNLRLSCIFRKLYDDAVCTAGFLVSGAYVSRAFVLPGEFPEVPLCGQAEPVDFDDGVDGFCECTYAVWNSESRQ